MPNVLIYSAAIRVACAVHETEICYLRVQTKAVLQHVCARNLMYQCDWNAQSLTLIFSKPHIAFLAVCQVLSFLSSCPPFFFSFFSQKEQLHYIPCPAAIYKWPLCTCR